MHRSIPPTAIALLCLTAVGGCSSRRLDSDFIPADSRARAAIEVALDAWIAGQGAGEVHANGLVVQMTDYRRKPGQNLMRYTVIGEAVGDGPSCYAVHLTFDKPAEEMDVRYVVLGIDPIWIIRNEDYRMMSHWDDMKPSGVPGATK